MAKTSVKENVILPKQKRGFSKTMQKWWGQKYLQLMVLPGIIWMLVFNYIPMGGIVIAFKKFRITDVNDNELYDSSLKGVDSIIYSLRNFTDKIIDWFIKYL